MRHEHADKVNVRTRALLDARLHDPYSMRGLHQRGDHYSVRVFEPNARSAWIAEPNAERGGVVG